MRATSSSRTAFLRERSLGTARVGVQLDAESVQLPLAKSREEDGRLAQRLAGQRPRVHGGASGLLGALDARHTLAVVRGLRGALFASRPDTDDDEVVVVVVGHGASLSGMGGVRTPSPSPTS